jgi:hypothetical protein
MFRNCGGKVSGDEKLGPDPLEVLERPSRIRGQGCLGLNGAVRKKVRNRAASNVPVEH